MSSWRQPREESQQEAAPFSWVSMGWLPPFTEGHNFHQVALPAYLSALHPLALWVQVVATSLLRSALP